MTDVDGVIPGIVVLGSLSKQANKLWEANQKTATLHGLCISSCLQVPALCEFLPSLLLMMNCYMEL